MTDQPEHDRVTGAALDAYRDTAHTSFRAVPPEVIVARARSRGRRRVALVAAAAVLAAGGTVVVVAGLGLRSDEGRIIDLPTTSVTTSVTTAGSPSATVPPSLPPSAAVVDPPPGTSASSAPARTTAPVDLRGVDWANLTVRMPTRKDDDECPTGRVTFADGSYDGGDTTTLIRPGYDGRTTYGDLNGDGRADAVVYVTCLEKEDSGDSSGQLLAVTGRTGSIVAMGYLGPLAQVFDDVAISGNRVTVTVTEKFSQVTQQHTYRWNGSRFTQTAGPTAFPEPS